MAGAVLAGTVVIVGAGGVAGYGLLAGWFDPGSVEGSTEGFVPDDTPTAAPATGSWPEYGRDAARSRANTGLRLDPPYRRVWSFDAGSLVEFPPVIGADLVVVGTNAGRAVALDLQSGRVVWRRPLGGVVASSPAIAGLPDAPLPGRQPATALFTTMRGDVIALRLSDGRPLWRLALRSPIESSPLIVDGAAYVGTADGRVVKVSLRTHDVVWTARTPGAVKGSLALAGSRVVVGDYAGRVSAFERGTGRTAWQTTSPGDRLRGAGRFYAGPAVAYGRVYVGNVNGRMLALSATDGRVAWVRRVGDYIYSSAAIADRLVYIGSYDRNIYALDAVTGRVRWTAAAGERISGSPSVIGGLVWYSTLAKRPREGRSVALDAATGRRVFTFPDGRYSPAVGVRGRLVITGVRTLYGLQPRAAARR